MRLIYANEVDRDDDDNFASNKDWEDAVKSKEYVKLISNMNNDDDKLEGIDKMGVKDELFINDDIANEKKPRQSLLCLST